MTPDFRYRAHDMALCRALSLKPQPYPGAGKRLSIFPESR